MSLLTLSLVVALCTAPHHVEGAEVRPRYVFLNKAPGIEWNAGRPDSFTRAGFDEIVTAIDPPENPDLRLGISFVFDFFRYDTEVLLKSLERFLALSQETGVPVLVNLDGQNWWGNRPDLWNWWDPAKPGYNPENAHNVEWTGWDADKAIKIAWRNWGSQIRVLPPMNIASPRVLTAHDEALQRILPVIVDWYDALPGNLKHLLGGVKLGHEAGIGYNAYHYPEGNVCLEQHPDDPSRDPASGLDMTKGFGGGLSKLGYAAVKTAGLQREGELRTEAVAKVTQQYLERMCRLAHKAGLPPHLVYTHQGGTYAPWDKHLPFWPAMNRYATPGWSFYGVDPASATGLAETLDKQEGQRWAATEWWWGAPDRKGWKDRFRRTLGYRNCRFIAIYNWNCGFRFKENQAGIRALHAFIQDWQEGR